MRPAPAWWRALSGPWVISIWSGLVGVAFTVPSALWTASYSGLDVGTALLVEAVAAVVALGMLWVAHSLWLSPTRAGTTYRPWLALATFVLVGLVRLAVMFGFRAAMGIEQPWSPFEALMTGGLYSIILLTLVAVLVDAVRRHALAMEELEQAKETLARATETEAAQVEELQRTFAEQVLRQVQQAITDLRHGDDPRQLAASIQEMSDRLVRAGSHDLQAGVVVESALEAPRPRVRLSRVLAGVIPGAAVIGPVAYEAVVFTAVWRDLGLTFALLNFVLGTATLVVGNLVLGAIARRWWPTHARLPILFLSYVAIGLAAVVVVQSAASLMGESRPLWVGGASYAVFMTLAAIIPSMRAQQSRVEVDLAQSVAALAEELSRVRSLALGQRANLAHLMHGGVQAELTAGALAISRSVERGDPPDAVDARMSELVSTLNRAIAGLDDSPAREFLDDVLGAWRMAIDLDARVDDAAVEAMEQDPDLQERVIDVVSEALTNAVRHAAARRVTLDVAVLPPDRISVDVRHQGSLAPGASGQGGATLSDRCESWSLTSTGDTVRLVAEIAPRLHQDA
jgi:signal transduction histidine kinase